MDQLESKPLKISFIGSLDWMPNMEGINWFLNNVWDRYLDVLGDVELHVAGRNTPDSFQAGHTKHKWLYMVKWLMQPCIYFILPGDDRSFIFRKWYAG
jgi:hypothetical protein